MCYVLCPYACLHVDAYSMHVLCVHVLYVAQPNNFECFSTYSFISQRKAETKVFLIATKPQSLNDGNDVL